MTKRTSPRFAACDRPTRFWIALLILVVALVSPRSGAAQAKKPQILDLFDGQSLAGWEGDPAHWRVADGRIIGEIPAGKTLNKNTWLVWKQGKLADFDLQLQFRLSGAPAANSGIQIRCQVHSVDRVDGYQADLDMGAVWLGRIYDEHGRALLVERGTRVHLAPDGKRRVETFAPAQPYAVLFRENDWNDYRIVAVGEHIQVFVNGTLFSELLDQQIGQRDLEGSLALQLHSGPETKVEFKNIRLEHLAADDPRMGKFSLPERKPESGQDAGILPLDSQQRELNLGFERGTLEHWSATGDAFRGQPVKEDGIAQRWRGQTSNKQGDYFIGGFETVQDRGVGTLVSTTFTIEHPYASFLVGGGQDRSTRVELVRPAADGRAEEMLFTASGANREQMERVAVDLRKFQGEKLFVRLVDENAGGWGHLNFDDFRFHKTQPEFASASGWRTTANPILQHLVANRVPPHSTAAGAETAAQMFLPPGFSAEVVAAEPHLYQPVAFTFDAKGRIWVVEGNSYPQKRPDGEGLDRILIFSDQDADGTLETRQVFIEKLNLVSGLEIGHGGVWVGAAPELLFIPDRNGDDRPDGPAEVVLDGFGFADTHETLNSFSWGPDGWLYGNQGVFNASLIGKPGTPDHERTPLQAGVWRYHPTRRVFEVFAHGGSNQWGLDYDEFGQFFMTHCRSFWGRGPTTHVMQGGHYWNQVNGGHAPFISPQAPDPMPWMRNFLLASARYGHGEGGAGKPGSNAVYGGHSHVGTMIYLGDNWPAEYRNHLFTHNLHGHQINRQVNQREAGGFNTVHAGRDVLFCADQQYVAVDLKYGPDGAVYITDWYDLRHCHNPNTEQWDRGNGRIYRVKFDATYRPVTADVTQYTDQQLVAAQLHANDWYVRKARQVLGERHRGGKLEASTATRLKELALTHVEPSRRLRAVWALHAIEALDAPLIEELMQDESEYVRAWGIQLGLESVGEKDFPLSLAEYAALEPSLFVRRYLACAIPRVTPPLGWEIADTLSQQPNNATDRDLPLLLWYGIARLMEQDLERGWQLADTTRIPVLPDYIYWYAAKLSDAGRGAAIARLSRATDGDEQLRQLTLLELGIRGMRGLAQPADWGPLASRLYDSSHGQIRRAAESVGAAFGDQQLFARLRQTLAHAGVSANQRRHALALLALDHTPQNLPILLPLLDQPEVSAQVIPLLARWDDRSVGEELIERLASWDGKPQATAALEVLASRVGWSQQLLDAFAAGQLPKRLLSAYVVRQMSNLRNEALNERLAKEWGTLGQSSAERQAEITKLVGAYQSAPLWAYNQQEGRNHYTKLCANCHQPQEQNPAIAPSLSGTGAKGIGYIVENILDPNAVIGRDFQARVIITVDGRVLNGLIEKETPSSYTIRTATNSVTVAKDDVDEMSISANSFMPEGLLKDLNDRERIELLKFLMTQ